VHGAALDPQQLVRFAFTLTSPRFLNLAIMQRTYSGGGGSPAIDVFCPSLLDLNHWLGCKETASSQDDQVRLLEQIAIMSGGAILPFVAYNPQSDIEQHDESFERVVTAIASRGFIGVKLYPPMGYLAYGNACEVRPGTCPMPENAKDIDKKLCRLYEWCVDQNVPIMSHTSHSFGATDADDDCASPFGWQRALENFAGLRVQAGHFGGESQYALDEKWAAQYVQMMGMRNARNLYVDLSNLGALFVPDSEVRKVIEPLFSMRLSAGSTEIAADRMLYGGDWYLTQLSNMSDVYVREMNLYLERIEGEKKIHGLRKSVFGQNAVKLYGLTPGPARGKATNWNRLKAYYVDKGISTPTWMCKLEASCEPARQ
jgi:predicted TIM-barrel fold metal-dependent hydrolase